MESRVKDKSIEGIKSVEVRDGKYRGTDTYFIVFDDGSGPNVVKLTAYKGRPRISFDVAPAQIARARFTQMDDDPVIEGLEIHLHSPEELSSIHRWINQ